MGDEAPSDPSLESFLTMVEASVQTEYLFENADPPFHALVVTAASSKPTFLFVLPLFSRLVPRLR
jgi:hypothetical protein